MKVKYNEKEKSIEIKDKQKTQYYAIHFLMIINIFNAVVNLYGMRDKQLEFMGYVWIILGIISLGIFVFFILKKSTLSKIPLKKIVALKEKTIFGKKRFSLQLTNGKSRDLSELKTQSDTSELKIIFAEIGIKIS
jgi:hypothetical protein